MPRTLYINRDVPRQYPEQAKEDGHYKSVLRFDGQRLPHPALVSI